MNNLEKYWDEHLDQYIEDLRLYVSFPSVATLTEDEKAPFGEANLKMIEYISDIFNHYGLESKIVKSVFAEGLLKGLDGKKTIAIACHGDVVPAEGDWDRNPFELYKKEDHLVGRGTTDNKGAAIAVLYALRYLMDNNIKLKSDIKLLVGSAEEIGMFDVPIAYPNGTGADFTLVPDSGFPLCYGEKASARFTLKAKLNSIISFNGGSGVGVVDKAEAILDDVSTLKNEDGIEVIKEENKVISYGKGRHAATPEGGEDAIYKLLNYLDRNNKLDSEPDLKLMLKSFPDFYGTGLSLNLGEYEEKDLTLVLTKAETKEDNYVYFKLNSRMPFSIKPKDLISEVEKKIPFCKNEGSTDGFYIPLTDYMLELNDIANKEYGTDRPPYIMAGGTYARMMQPAVPFGMGSPLGNKQPPFPQGEGRAHQRNESVDINRMKKGFIIYVKALLKLDEALND